MAEQNMPEAGNSRRGFLRSAVMGLGAIGSIGAQYGRKLSPVAPGTNTSFEAKKFAGKHSHRVLKDIGHNVPQEAPQVFAQAVIDVDSY